MKLQEILTKMGGFFKKPQSVETTEKDLTNVLSISPNKELEEKVTRISVLFEEISKLKRYIEKIKSIIEKDMSFSEKEISLSEKDRAGHIIKSDKEQDPDTSKIESLEIEIRNIQEQIFQLQIELLIEYPLEQLSITKLDSFLTNDVLKTTEIRLGKDLASFRNGESSILSKLQEIFYNFINNIHSNKIILEDIEPFYKNGYLSKDQYEHFLNKELINNYFVQLRKGTLIEINRGLLDQESLKKEIQIFKSLFLSGTSFDLVSRLFTQINLSIEEISNLKDSLLDRLYNGDLVVENLETFIEQLNTLGLGISLSVDELNTKRKEFIISKLKSNQFLTNFNLVDLIFESDEIEEIINILIESFKNKTVDLNYILRNFESLFNEQQKAIFHSEYKKLFFINLNQINYDNIYSFQKEFLYNDSIVFDEKDLNEIFNILISHLNRILSTKKYEDYNWLSQIVTHFRSKLTEKQIAIFDEYLSNIQILIEENKKNMEELSSFLPINHLKSLGFKLDLSGEKLKEIITILITKTSVYDKGISTTSKIQGIILILENIYLSKENKIICISEMFEELLKSGINLKGEYLDFIKSYIGTDKFEEIVSYTMPDIFSTLINSKQLSSDEFKERLKIIEEVSIKIENKDRLKEIFTRSLELFIDGLSIEDNETIDISKKILYLSFFYSDVFGKKIELSVDQNKKIESIYEQIIEKLEKESLEISDTDLKEHLSIMFYFRKLLPLKQIGNEYEILTKVFSNTMDRFLKEQSKSDHIKNFSDIFNIESYIKDFFMTISNGSELVKDFELFATNLYVKMNLVLTNSKAPKSDKESKVSFTHQRIFGRKGEEILFQDKQGNQLFFMESEVSGINVEYFEDKTDFGFIDNYKYPIELYDQKKQRIKLYEYSFMQGAMILFYDRFAKKAFKLVDRKKNQFKGTRLSLTIKIVSTEKENPKEKDSDKLSLKRIFQPTEFLGIETLGWNTN